MIDVSECGGGGWLFRVVAECPPNVVDEVWCLLIVGWDFFVCEVRVVRLGLPPCFPVGAWGVGVQGGVVDDVDEDVIGVTLVLRCHAWCGLVVEGFKRECFDVSRWDMA